MNFSKYLTNQWVLLFFYLLIVATFVTVAIYVYAGEQQNLETRKFNDVDLQGDLVVDGDMFIDGFIYHSSPLVKSNITTVNLTGSTINLQDYLIDTSTHYLFVVNSSSATTMTMPDTSFILDILTERGTNSYFDWGVVVNIGSGTLTQVYNTADHANLIPILPITPNTGTFAQKSGVGLLYQYYEDEDNTENVLWFNG